MDRIWTWLGVGVLCLGVIGVADMLSVPAPAAAQGGSALSQPVPPATDLERTGSIRNQIGWTTAKQRWQLNMPLGRGIPVGQVEAGNAYLPNPAHIDLRGTGFIRESGATQNSGHALTVARHAFGPDSAGQGVNAVHCFSVNDWLSTGFLNSGTADPPRGDHAARVFNHSWIASGMASAPLILRRVDYLIDTHDVLVVCGVNNGPGNVPDLLASAYNTISVGVSSGNNTDGRTRIEGEGRCKPEIVAPGGKTSWSTGVVTGCVAALLEVADRMHNEAPEGKGEHAQQSEVIKAVLLAGAHKPANWAQPEAEPLDRKLGAGIVDLDRSLVILEAGPVEPDTQTDQRYGWSFAQLGSSEQHAYKFIVDAEQGDTTLALVWHRRVLGGKAQVQDPDTGQTVEIWNPAQFAPNLELGLFRVNDENTETPVVFSKSAVDNLELIHLRTLPPGDYALRTARLPDDYEGDWDYALAWRIEAKEQE